MKIKTYFMALVGCFIPKYCVACKSRLADTEQILCSRCLCTLSYSHITNHEDNIAARLFWGRIPVERAYFHFYYRHDAPSKNLLMALKYSHLPTIGTLWGKTMATELIKTKFFDEIEAIIPVPLHWLRRLERGYNQSEQLARGIAEVTGIKIDNKLVHRAHYTFSQSKKSVRERAENMQGKFRSGKARYKHVLLVDDVLTTGATLNSLAEAILLENPHVKISILTLAKA